MRIERALRLREELVQRIRDAYSTAQIACSPSTKLDESLRRALEAPKGAPYWVKSYADGYSAALRDALYRESLVFGGIVDGIFYSTHSKRPDYYEKNGIAPSDYADDGRVKMRGHYWAHDTTRPFFTNEKES